jgi:FKBP-type peptidyl-prolyl cis-trans isomerase
MIDVFVYSIRCIDCVQIFELYHSGTSGELPPAEYQIEAHYTGTLESGEKFDSSRDR